MILLSLGSNLASPVGGPAATLRFALSRLAVLDIVPIAISNFYVTKAWPNPADPEFVNAAAEIRTALDPAALLKQFHVIEEQLGRCRGAANAPRTLDLDLLDYDGRIDAGPPQLPHPRMAGRGFVLIPLAEVAPAWRHPVTNQTVSELISNLGPDERRIDLLAE
jgi:2-amino-4-hydroxy-6-hydroxymethyldihydropteridine diphosphokinase